MRVDLEVGIDDIEQFLLQCPHCTMTCQVLKQNMMKA